MIRHILVPLDGSPVAESVLPCVRTFAQLTGAEITLCQAVEPLPDDETILEVLLAQAEPELNPTEHAHTYLVHTAQALSHHGLTVHTRVLTGHAADQIVGVAPEYDLIAMATHGRSGIGRWVYGSVADKVLHAAPVPVLLIRAREEAMPAACPLQRILVPLDGSEFAEQVLPLAVSLARQAGAELTLVHSIAWAQVAMADPYGYGGTGFSTTTLLDEAEASAQTYLDEVKNSLTAGDVPIRTVVRIDAAPSAILDYAAEHQSSLIIMSTHGRSGVGRWVLGSTADRVLRNATIPVLLIRAGVPAIDSESPTKMAPASS